MEAPIRIEVGGTVVFETSRTAYGGRCSNKPITAAQHTLPFLRGIRGHAQEHFIALYLDGAGYVLEARLITTGLLDCNQVHPREVFRPAIALPAAGIIAAHNHPSKTLEPSAEDIALTKRLISAGKIIGIPILDHIIVTAEGHISMRQVCHIF